MVPKENSQKLRWKMAITQISAPTMPNPAPVRKPGRRPTRRMNSEAGTVDSAVPITKVDTGSVAQLTDGAICVPTRPAVMMMLTADMP